MLKKILPPILFLLVIVGLLWGISNQKKKNNEIASQFATIDFNDFKFIEPVQNYELNENSVICFFSSNCSLCSYEAEQLKKEEFIPETLDFIWVSAQTRDSVISFIESNNLSGVKHFKFAQIDSTILAKKYNVKEYPRGLIYKNGVLCHVYKGVIGLYQIKLKLKNETFTKI